MEDCLKALSGKILFRDSIIKTLLSLVGHEKSSMAESIFLYGHTATGKTLVVRKTLEQLGHNFSIINCIEHPTAKHLLESIIADLSDCVSNSPKAASNSGKCDNLMDFVTLLKSISLENESNIVIVFENCERLLDLDSTLFSAFLCLKDITKVGVSCIFISQLPWSKLSVRGDFRPPIKIHFPQYTMEEAKQILMLRKPCEYEDEFYERYLSLFAQTLFKYCRDLNELFFMAGVNFQRYIEPIKKGVCTTSDKNVNNVLWRHISQIFMANMNSLYLRIFTDDSKERLEIVNTMGSVETLVQSFELPFYGKYMLIAAYLASHNPVKYDKHLFLEMSERKKKSKKPWKKNYTEKARITAKIFGLDRMIHIYHAIINEEVHENANLISQITTMCNLGLLANVTDINLDEPKYRCCVDFDFVQVISKDVGFEVNKYLFYHVH